MFYRIIGCILFSILAIEVYSCDYNLNFPVTSYGNFSVLESTVTTISSRDIPKTRFTFSSSIETRNSLLFVGDVMLARNVEFLMNLKGSEYPFLGINFSDFDNKPLVVGNFESSIPEQHTMTKEEQLQFSVDKLYLSELKKSGFSYFSLANNHSYDFGKTAFENTRFELQENGMSSFGNPKDFSKNSVAFVNIGGERVALIGIYTLEKVPTDNELFNVFNYAEKNSDFQIVYVHWGNEYDEESNFLQKKLATRFVEAGADLIIGHHPHVVQEIDYIGGVLVFYSLGNYIFDQYFSETVQNGLLLHLDLTNNEFVSLIPITSTFSLSQPTYMTPEKHAAFLALLANKSHEKLRDYIKEGIIPLNINVATSSKIAMIKI